MSIVFTLRPEINGVLQIGKAPGDTSIPDFPVIVSPAAGGGAGHVHSEASPVTPWIVNHNLGRRPVVQIISAGGVEVEAEITHITVNQFTITFVQPFAGQAIAR